MKDVKYKEKILLKTPVFLISTNASEELLYHEYFKPVSLNAEELRVFYEIVEKANFKAYLIKIPNGNVVPHEDKSWPDHLDLSSLFSSGIAQIAYVSPQNIFNSCEVVKELEDGNIKIMIFKYEEDAFLWLESELD